MQQGEMAEFIKAQNLHGMVHRRSDRHKREGGYVIPGEIWPRCLKGLPASRGDGKPGQKSAEGIVGVGSDAGAEGPNKQERE
jgi:hypothetical protein